MPHLVALHFACSISKYKGERFELVFIGYRLLSKGFFPAFRIPSFVSWAGELRDAAEARPIED